MKWLCQLISTFPNTTKIIFTSIILAGIALGWYIQAQWKHEENTMEIMNKYSTEKRSLEIALENCQ